MTYFMNQNDLTELNKIDDIVKKSKSLNNKLKMEISENRYNNFNYQNPTEKLSIALENLTNTLDIKFSQKIAVAGISSFSENDKNEYKEILHKLDSIISGKI